MADIPHNPEVDVYKTDIKNNFSQIMTDLGAMQGLNPDPDFNDAAFIKNRLAIIRLSEIVEGLIKVVKKEL